MPICRLCNNLNLGELDYVGGTLPEIHKSSEYGCVTCSIVYEGVAHFSKLFNVTNEESIRVKPATQLATPPSLGVELDYGHRDPGADGFEINLEFYQLKGKRATLPFTHRARDIGDNSSSKSSFTIINQWLKECLEQHPQCASPQINLLPSRVLDLTSDNVKLSETQGQGAQNPYVTLSHCWGQKDVIKTMRKTLESRKQGIPWTSLSKTFQDAITVTRELGFYYLWIDSLCIIQDDEEDWERESANMASIYAGSQLTIAASFGADGESGCFSSRQLDPNLVKGSRNAPKDIDPAPSHLHKVTGQQADGTDFEVSVRLALDHVLLNPQGARNISDYHTQGVPLFSRGWVLQERLLSPRILYFMKQELVWECSTHMHCECSFLDGYGKSLSIKNLFESSDIPSENPSEPQKLYGGRWGLIVEQFSKLELTYESDCLSAISGLAHRESESSRQPGAYLAGLWIEDLPMALLWQSTQGHEPFAKIHRQIEYWVPSWSWASVRGPISYSNRMGLAKIDPSVQITYAASVPSGEDPFGEIQSGCIGISSLVVDAEANPRIFDIESPMGKCEISVCELRVGDLTHSFMLDVPILPGQEEVVSGDKVVCILIAINEYSNHPWMLVLKALKSQSNTFERIGTTVIDGSVWKTLGLQDPNVSNDIWKFKDFAYERNVSII